MLYILFGPIHFKTEIQKKIISYWCQQGWTSILVRYIGYEYPAVFPPQGAYQKQPKVICDGGYDRFMGIINNR